MGNKAADLEVQILEIKGHCPVYGEGDVFLIQEGYKLMAPEGSALCLHGLASLLTFSAALSRGITPHALGLGPEGSEQAMVQCPDPCERTGGGTVLFGIRRLSSAGD
jgi:uncharacterized repeat protein (TIGR04076 family)